MAIVFVAAGTPGCTKQAGAGIFRTNGSRRTGFQNAGVIADFAGAVIGFFAADTDFCAVPSAKLTAQIIAAIIRFCLIVSFAATVATPGFMISGRNARIGKISFAVAAAVVFVNRHTLAPVGVIRAINRYLSDAFRSQKVIPQISAVGNRLLAIICVGCFAAGRTVSSGTIVFSADCSFGADLNARTGVGAVLAFVVQSFVAAFTRVAPSAGPERAVCISVASRPVRLCIRFCRSIRTFLRLRNLREYLSVDRENPCTARNRRRHRAYSRLCPRHKGI